jgi:hypothetical protein
MPLGGQPERPHVATPSRPARDQKRTLFLVEDKVSYVRQPARVSDATWLPINVAVEHRGVKLAVLVHEHELLAELVLETPRITPRPFFDRWRRRRMMIAHAKQFTLVHTDDDNRRHGGSQHRAAGCPVPTAAQPPNYSTDSLNLNASRLHPQRIERLNYVPERLTIRRSPTGTPPQDA